jgi:hypothetical protein
MDNRTGEKYWEATLFDSFFEKALLVYKKIWVAILILWIATIVAVFINPGWQGGILIIFEILFSFGLAAFGHTADRSVLIRGYPKPFGRLLMTVTYILGIIGYVLIIAFPILNFITLAK